MGGKRRPLSELREVPEQLLRAIQAAPLIPEEDINGYVMTRGIDSLNRRELDILRYLSRGLTIAQTADAVQEPLETVKHRMKSARFKLGAKSRTQACCEAIRRGLIP